ncbi:hypothetical protein PCL_08727 [Purpureocillium lilacinum]|uniref:Uncharacterized protein n=1 Tax=Purpureocillium lilacinum TaxID=33203 RepID=A0A2U3EG16_PURLI|nr:hypothetical protein PCL_08727 [Purpureocillium lilacinum]
MRFNACISPGAARKRDVFRGQSAARLFRSGRFHMSPPKVGPAPPRAGYPIPGAGSNPAAGRARARRAPGSSVAVGSLNVTSPRCENAVGGQRSGAPQRVRPDRAEGAGGSRRLASPEYLMPTRNRLLRAKLPFRSRPSSSSPFVHQPLAPGRSNSTASAISNAPPRSGPFVGDTAGLPRRISYPAGNIRTRSMGCSGSTPRGKPLLVSLALPRPSAAVACGSTILLVVGSSGGKEREAEDCKGTLHFGVDTVARLVLKNGNQDATASCFNTPAQNVYGVVGSASSRHAANRLPHPFPCAGRCVTMMNATLTTIPHGNAEAGSREPLLLSALYTYGIRHDNSVRQPNRDHY